MSGTIAGPTMPVVLLVILFCFGWLFLPLIRGVAYQDPLLRWILLKLRRPDPAVRRGLEQHSGYFRALPPRMKRLFVFHVEDLMEEKEWIGRGIFVDREMKLRISAAIAQVTFGFQDLLLVHFSRIAVYPDAYRNPRTGHMHLGEVAPGAGLLILSWKHFEEGFADPADGRNLALHEAAHALWFENVIPNAEDDFLDPAALKRWRILAGAEAERIRQGEPHLFRAYAATDQAEFFAVAVEYFFERPADFKAQLPELFTCLTRLLRQEPSPAAQQADLQNI